MNKRVALAAVSNAAEDIIDLSRPFIAEVVIQGSSDLIFHRWSVSAIAEKAKAAKNSKAKKTDNVESYVWRDDDNNLCLPGEYVRQSIIHAAKFRQDPRSPRKSAMDLYKAAIVSLTNLASLGAKDWDYEDQRRVVIQRAGVNRIRPAMRVGWKAEVQLMVLLPEYIQPMDLQDVLTNAGKLIGVGDFRPTFGRFQIIQFGLQEAV